MLNLSISPGGGGIHGLPPMTPALGPFVGIVPQLSPCRQDRDCPMSACRNGRCGCYWDNDCRNDKCCDKSDYSDIPGRCNRDCYSGTTPPPIPPPLACSKDSDCRGYNMCCINGLSNYPFPSPWNGRGQGQCGECASECSVKRSCGPGKYCIKGVCELCKNECSGSSGCGRGKCCTTIYDGPCGERSFCEPCEEPPPPPPIKKCYHALDCENGECCKSLIRIPVPNFAVPLVTPPPPRPGICGDCDCSKDRECISGCCLLAPGSTGAGSCAQSSSMCNAGGCNTNLECGRGMCCKRNGQQRWWMDGKGSCEPCISGGCSSDHDCEPGQFCKRGMCFNPRPQCMQRIAEERKSARWEGVYQATLENA